MKWLSERDMAAPGVRLFCLPHAGSGTAGFHRWKCALPDSIAVCPVMLPGREARLAEALLTRVLDIVDALHEEAKARLDKPYAIFGHSMGSLLAYEWVRRIDSEGSRRPECLFVSGRNAPQLPLGHRKLHELPKEEFVRELQALYGGDGEMLKDVELRDIFLPILRADLEAVEAHEHREAERVQCDLMAFAGVNDRSVSDVGLNAWGEMTAREFSVRRFTGDHFYPFDAGQTELLKVISERLTM